MLVGLTTVEIWAEGVHLDPRVGSVASVHLPFVVSGGSALECIDSWVQSCEETLHRGAGAVVAHPVIHHDPDEPSQSGVRRLGDALRRIADQAAHWVCGWRWRTYTHFAGRH